jgi:hypothetical protein
MDQLNIRCSHCLITLPKGSCSWVQSNALKLGPTVAGNCRHMNVAKSSGLPGYVSPVETQYI